MPHLGVIVSSTRPGRVGRTIADWFVAEAGKHGKFDVHLLDLAEIALPLLDEPHHPRLRKYEKPHTLAWSAKVAAMDAFAIVTPEYNHGSPPALINALDYLVAEWAYKPATFVAYGGQSGGLRSVQMTKLVLTALKMMPIPEAVVIPAMTKHVHDGLFVGDESHAKASHAALDELHRWTVALATLRA